MIPEGSNEKKRGRWRRWLGRTALGLLGLLVAGLVSTWLRLIWEASQGRKELAAVIAETDESDPRWRWDDIEADRQPVPDAENSMLVIRKVEAGLGKWAPTELKLLDGRPIIGNDHPANRRLGDPWLAGLHNELGKREQTVALAATLKDYSRGHTRVRLTLDTFGTLLPHVQPVRHAAGLLALDVERLAHAGQAERAADRIRAILRAADGLRDEPLFIPQLVRMACQTSAVYRIERLLGLAGLSEATCRALLRDLDAERQDNILLVGVRGERAAMHNFFDNVGQGRVSLADVLAGVSRSGSPDLLTKAGSFLYSYRVPEDHAASLRWFGRFCDVARLPYHERAAAALALDVEIKATRATAQNQKRLLLFYLLTPAVTRVEEAATRNQAQLVSAQAALAVECFRLANKRWPTSLAELCPALLKSVPLDPCTGEPLRYARHGDGVAVYSVGPDLEDDGGKALRFRPGENGDVGVRLYDPAHRNLPPLVEPVSP